MKHITFCLLILMTGMSCKKIDKLTHFNMNYQYKCVLDQTTIFGNSFDIITTEIPTKKDSIFLAEETTKYRVSQIELKTLILRVENMDSIPEGYFQSIEIYLLDPDQPDKLIAWNDQIHNNTYDPFILTLSTDDLSFYLTKPTIQYRIHGTLMEQHDIKTFLSLETQYFVNAAINN